MKKRFVTYGVAAAIALGTGAGGAVLGLASPSNAADSSAATSTTVAPSTQTPGGPGSDHGPGRRPGGPGGGLAVAAKAIGVTEDDLVSALKAGKSIADVAADKGVSEQTVIDAIVADHKTHIAADVTAGHLTQAEADAKIAELPAKVKDNVEHKGLPDGPGPGGPGGPGGHGPGGPGGGPGGGLAVAAKAIGVTEDDLVTALKAGKSIADVAADKGVSEQTVIDAIVADHKTHIAADVTAGHLTQAEADAKIAELPAKVKDNVEHKGLPDGPGPGGPGGPGGHGPGGPGGGGPGGGGPGGPDDDSPTTGAPTTGTNTGAPSAS